MSNNNQYGIETVAAAWKDFTDQVFPDGMHQMQEAQLKDAFYAGQLSMLIMCKEVSCRYSEGMAEIVLNNLGKELENYLEEKTK